MQKIWITAVPEKNETNVGIWYKIELQALDSEGPGFWLCHIRSLKEYVPLHCYLKGTPEQGQSSMKIWVSIA